MDKLAKHVGFFQKPYLTVQPRHTWRKEDVKESGFSNRHATAVRHYNICIEYSASGGSR